MRKWADSELASGGDRWGLFDNLRRSVGIEISNTFLPDLLDSKEIENKILEKKMLGVSVGTIELNRAPFLFCQR